LVAIGCLSKQEIQKEVSTACGTANECVFASFLSLMNRLLKDEAQPEDIQEAFRVFDKNNNGHISSEDLKKILQAAGPDQMTQQDVEELLKDMGVDDEGDIDYEAFIKKLKK
jgi:calmodulin